MSYTCPNFIPCCPDTGPCSDNPALTLPKFKSGEGVVPGKTFIGINPGNPQDVPPIGGGGWTDWTCLTSCTSEVSQQDADNCAAFQTSACNNDPPLNPANPANGGDLGGSPISGRPPSPPRHRFSNNPQTCTIFCSGGFSTWTIPAGTFGAYSQILADRMAYTYACYQAEKNLVCLSAFKIPTQQKVPGTNFFPVTISSFEGKCCGGAQAIFIIQAGGKGPFDWSIIGSLPSGFNFTISDDTRTITISGATPAGTNETFTVQVRQRFTGITASRDYTIQAMGYTD